MLHARRTLAITACLGTAVIGGALAFAGGDGFHASYRRPGWGGDPAIERFADELERRAFDREVRRRQLLREPISWRDRERRLDELEHEAFRDQIEFRNFVRNHTGQPLGVPIAWRPRPVPTPVARPICPPERRSGVVEELPPVAPPHAGFRPRADEFGPPPGFEEELPAGEEGWEYGSGDPEIAPPVMPDEPGWVREPSRSGRSRERVGAVLSGLGLLLQQ